MNKMMTLIHKECIEYPILFRLPAAICLFIVLFIGLMLTGNGNVEFSIHANGDSMLPSVADFLSFGGTVGNVNAWVASVVAMILFLIYTPKAMRKELDEGSLMFWRSMPVSDWQTVTTKLLFALVALPIIASCVLVFSDLVVWVISWWHLPDTMPASSVTLWGLLLHWLTFIGRMAAVSLTLVPFTCILFVLSQLTRSPLIILLVGIFILNLATMLVFDSTLLGDLIKRFYQLPMNILFSDKPLATLLTVDFLYFALMVLVSGLCLVFSVKLRQTDDFLAK
ncbi:hypothetical protein A3K86_02235 [Photobacterium jeanii]|uniref:ABC transporter n=1 Tax=Photobacterium jeanii TaxID=858640 RepID=A0A178KKA7_9GAMM|nr:hypothetical protein [Photobacterium jeanii]OAN17759.1 hypothetical protein A3K86_02235 [Photobacterium jeanii]PST92576.1 ABC transporter [Photobacterium jeanii]